MCTCICHSYRYKIEIIGSLLKGNELSLEWANTKENMELVDTSTDTMIVGAKDATNEDAFKIWDRNDDVEIDLENVNDNADDDLI